MSCAAAVKTTSDARLSTFLPALTLVFSVAAIGPLMIINSLLWRYDRLSYAAAHAPWIRRLLPRRPAAYVGPLLPLYSVAVLELRDAAAEAIAVVVGLALAEVYAVCLRRETYIAAFEPWLLPPDYKPLGARPGRIADRRLQHIARIQCVYCVPLLAVGIILDVHDPAASWVTACAFFAKYVPLSSLDFAAYFHWDIHCRVLDLPDRPRLAAAWRAAADWLTGPMIGYLPNFYRTEHLIVHHPENAGPEDIHSPLPYDRRRAVEFCVYGFRTCISMLTAWAVLTHRRCHRRQRASLLRGVLVYWFAVLMLIVLGGRLAAFWLIAAVLHHALNAALAQYVWHGLCDPSNPRHPKASTILWLPAEHLSAGTDLELGIDVPELGTDWAFYDNYHLIHHLHPRAHFAEYPELLRKEVPELLRSGCVVLRLERYDRFIEDCWSGNLAGIASGLVTTIPQQDRRAFLEARLAALPSHRSRAASVSEGRLGSAVNTVLTRCYLRTAWR